MSTSAADFGVRRATPADAVDLAPRLRRADVDEVWAASGSGPNDALLRAVEAGSWAGTVDGEVEAIFGTHPMTLLGDVGCIYLLGSDAIERHARPFLRMSRRYVQAVRQDYGVLMNWVDARNAASVRWLRWLGFAIMSPAPFGPFGLPFHRFEMRHV
jgi:hypothetical protein